MIYIGAEGKLFYLVGQTSRAMTWRDFEIRLFKDF